MASSFNNMGIHRFIGLVLAVVYLLLFSGNLDWFQGFNNSAAVVAEGSPVSKAHRGISTVYWLAFMSCYCLIFPRNVSMSMSPRTGLLQERILKSGFFVFFGYFFTLVTFLILGVFEP